MALFPSFDEPTKTPSHSSGSFDPLVEECPPTDNILTARMAFVSETPSLQEVKDREPFVGPSGAQFNRITAACNLPRHECYITNACKASITGNNMNKLWTAKGYKHPEWGMLQKRLIEELSEFPGRIIVLMGATAMRLLIDDPRFTSLTKYAGSIYRAEDFPHLATPLAGKFIAITYHPASTLPRANPINLYVMIANLKKFLALDEDPELFHSPRVKTLIKPLFSEVLDFLHLARTKPEFGFDIEATPKYTTCFSVAIEHNDEIQSMSIPLMDNSGNYWSIHEEVEILTALAELLRDPNCEIIAQNGMFDLMYMLRTMNMVSDAFTFDTMIAQHICYTDLPKGLDFLTSAYTYYPYYKDEGKQSHLSAIKDWPMYWEYNAKDGAYMIPIRRALEKELLEFGATDAMEYSMDLHKPLMEMEYNGILTNQEEIANIRKKFERYITAMQKGLRKLSGQDLNINSPKQMVAYFYGTCGIKPYVSRTSGNATCDAVALARIAKKGVKGSAEARLIMKIRYYYKLMSTYFKIKMDEDNHLRCHHKITGTTSGRIATQKTYFGTGANLQNQPPLFKKYLLPDPEHILVEVDLARAEAHVVAYLCQDAAMIDAFESGIDVHTFNASKIFGIPMEQVTKHQRSLGKKIVHASNYLMGPGTFSNNLAKDFIFYSQSKCKTLLNAYKARFPLLQRWQKQVQLEVGQTRMLYNLFGRPKRFLGMMNDALFRNAISYIPQSTVAELLNRGTNKVCADPRLGRDGYDIDLLTTVHDSDVFQLPYKMIPDLLDILLIFQDHLSHTFTHFGRSFTIGLDATIGTAWKGNAAEIATFDQPSIDAALKEIGL